MSTKSTEISNRRESAILYFTATAAVAAVTAYALAFQGAPPGDPSSWGQFGDYFAGIVNPIIGLATVLLIVRTLDTTRIEALRQRMQFDLESEKSELHRRLEGALHEWNSLMTKQLTISRVEAAGLLGYFRGRTIGETFSDPHVFDLATMSGADAILHYEHVIFNKMIPALDLLEELSIYVREYDDSTGNKVVSNFYRRRVKNAVHILGATGLLNEEIADALHVGESPRTL